MHFTYDTVQIGDEMPSLSLGPISRTTLALFAGASGDHNPIHIDIDFARAAGMSDVFAHGMLVMAYLGRALTECAPQSAVRSFGVRFAAITHVGDRIKCTGKVIEKLHQNGEKRIRIALSAADQIGEIKAAGEALIAVP